MRLSFSILYLFVFPLFSIEVDKKIAWYREEGYNIIIDRYSIMSPPPSPSSSSLIASNDNDDNTNKTTNDNNVLNNNRFNQYKMNTSIQHNSWSHLSSGALSPLLGIMSKIYTETYLIYNNNSINRGDQRSTNYLWLLLGINSLRVTLVDSDKYNRLHNKSKMWAWLDVFLWKYTHYS